MEGQEVSKTLPEDLVGSILSKVPFPYIFKARVLSKSWLARFSSIATQEDEEKKSLVASLQKEVGDGSTTWKTFSPLLILGDDLIGYDRESHSWLTMPSLSSVPGDIFLRSDLQVEGALVLWSGMLAETEDGLSLDYVANILIRRGKFLPPRPNPGEIPLVKKLVNLQGMYKVIAIFGGIYPHFVVQIYDSRLDAWSTKKHIVSKAYCDLGDPVYLNGVLYMIADQNPRDLVALNVEEETLEELEMPFIDTKAIPAGLVVCSANLMIIAFDRFHVCERMVLLKVDPVSRTLLEVNQGPPAALNVDRSLTRSASHGDCIFFMSASHGNITVLEYNVRDNEWSNVTLPISTPRTYQWTVCSFEPGLNTFLAV